MNATHNRFLMIFLICGATSISTGIAQETQGNIVEYFGKEKVTDVREGTVVHTFTRGLVLAGDRSSGDDETTPKDPVVSSILLDPTYEITEGMEAGVSSRGDVLRWEPIEVGENNEFSDRQLRSGYLYLEYTSDREQTLVLDASGHTKLFVNGLPREGDHYDFGWSLIPVQLNAGTNTFLLTGGRFPRMRARLLEADAPTLLTPRDTTLPDILKEENGDLLGAIRILNADEQWFEGEIICELGGLSRATPVESVSPLNSRKVPFTIPSPSDTDQPTLSATLKLKNLQGVVVSELEVSLNTRSKYTHHNRTFLSQTDGSVQYFGVAPATDRDIENPALFLSVHGASVEASGQARAYQQKDWGHLVAPTNRRPYGFAWEDWGRLDAMEVLEYAENLYNTDRQRTYLTGHSMGGHGTWYLGATYPDRFAAIGPAAGYPDLLAYRNSFRRRLETATDSDLQAMGMTRARADALLNRMSLPPANPEMDAIIRRAGNPSRTLKLQRNYLSHGVYILHGEKDTVVPTFLARDMRETLAKFHPDFCYYEYPNGTHWYGNHSVDWKPLFDFFEFRKIQPPEAIDRLEFYTASPGVSASSHFVTILQQTVPFEISSMVFNRDEIPDFRTDNVHALSIDVAKMGTVDALRVDNQEFDVPQESPLVLKRVDSSWAPVDSIPLAEKGPHRNGGFKDAFRNRFVLVYATQGTDEENTWYYNRARSDAEIFYYRANGNVEIAPDTDFSPESYSDRNVILYGNRDNNAAWDPLLSHSPLQVSDGAIQLGDRELFGDRYGAYFIYPRSDSDSASVGVVSASGTRGMKATYRNDYLLNGTTFPDVLIVDDTVLAEGLEGVVASGFFGNDWSIESGDFVWR